MEPTERQLRFIREIEDVLGITFDGATKKEASEWIDKHISAFELETLDDFAIVHGYF